MMFLLLFSGPLSARIKSNQEHIKYGRIFNLKLKEVITEQNSLGRSGIN
ncbi:hypothetical protein PITCH_A2120002 [uncultured Desulfobacterium sp.]|uniref:Uncharacterized protein n=1 Tax=uncultured Desulfobacterium sp. TaxID=201089 RepID=A0A445MXD8_9BACT|nr:hypothetical protein PITCH_A2120002 [uncultured Desulfobacterium sp.]